MRNLRRVEVVYSLMFRCGHTERFHVRWPVTKRAIVLLKRRAIANKALLCPGCDPDFSDGRQSYVPVHVSTWPLRSGINK